MTFRHLIVGAVALATLPAWAQSAPSDVPRAALTTSAKGSAPLQISPERLQALRQSLLARIAVYDAAEKAMRLPTTAELSALNANAAPSGSQRIVAMPGGGLAARADASEMSFLVAEIQADGKTMVRHAATPKPTPEQAKGQPQTSSEGGARAQ